MKNGELWNILYRLVKNEQDRGKLYHFLKSIGNVEDLQTINKNTLVEAINEVNSNELALEEDVDNLKTIIEENEEIIAKALCDLNDRIKIINIETSIPSTGMAPDTVYNLGDITEDPDVTIRKPTELTKDHEYILIFNIGATAPDTITFPEDVIFTDTPSWDINSHYEINIKWDNVNELYYALVQSWEIEEEV